jgi:hypothetical protein
MRLTQGNPAGWADSAALNVDFGVDFRADIVQNE